LLKLDAGHDPSASSGRLLPLSRKQPFRARFPLPSARTGSPDLLCGDARRGVVRIFPSNGRHESLPGLSVPVSLTRFQVSKHPRCFSKTVLNNSAPLPSAGSA
jgi:hypothetical protein